jgi:hypothetical protein
LIRERFADILEPGEEIGGNFTFPEVEDQREHIG